MQAGILVTPPTGFEVSTDNSTFAPTVTISTAGEIASTPVYIRLAAATVVGSYSGNVILSSTNAVSVNMATISSTVSATTPVVASTSPTTAINITTATLAGVVSSDGGAAVTARGIVYGSAASPVIGGGGVTNATASGTTGAFAVNLSGLSLNTTYHYRAYATNSIGTTYGIDQTFTTGPNTLDKLSLNNTTPAAGAYSLRLLSSNYTGPLARVFFGSSYYDVYPDATAAHTFSVSSPVSAVYTNYNNVITGATTNLLSSVIGTNTATVAIWYDQSGNGYNAMQSNATQQPRIMVGGTVVTTNNLPTLRFFGSQWLIVASTGFNNDLSGSVVYGVNAAPSSGGSNTWYAMNGLFWF